jgi:hypothetical protein
VDYYIDKNDPHKKEFGIPTKAIALAPRDFPDGTPAIRSKANFNVSRPESSGCYSVGGVGLGA